MRKNRFAATAFVLGVILVISLLSPLLTGHADVLYEPDNKFFERNREKMRSLGRSFYANGEDGYVTLHLEPGSRRQVATVENGGFIYIMFTYDDGSNQWGVAELNSHPDRPTGWVRMDQLHAVYDEISFRDEHGSEFIKREYDVASLDTEREGDIVLWIWPGSGKISSVLEHFLKGLEPGIITGSIIYLDEEGHEWGFFSGYIMGYRNGWIYLDDPSNHEIPAFNPSPVPDLYPARSPDGSQGSLYLPILAISLVSLAAIVSLILIRVLWTRESKKKSDSKPDSDGEFKN